MKNKVKIYSNDLGIVTIITNYATETESHICLNAEEAEYVRDFIDAMLEDEE